MKRALKLTGASSTRTSPAFYNLPDGHYTVPVGRGGAIQINVNHGPAGVSVYITSPDPLLIDAGNGTPFVESRAMNVTHYSPGDGYAQAFKA